jgi:hypothetical protein
MINLALRSIFVYTCKRYFTCRKILRVASGGTSPLKEGALRIFIALKNPSPQLGLNPRTLGLTASTLTITPPKDTHGTTPQMRELPTKGHDRTIRKVFMPRAEFELGVPD